MRIQKFTHSCLLVEDADARVLLDPGTFSSGFEQLRGLTAVLITHAHPDHLDLDRLESLLAANPDAAVYADAGSAAALTERGITATVTDANQSLQIGALPVQTFGSIHAVIHPDIPLVPNVGYLLGGRLFHPGDALTVPPVEVELLALPTAAPWMKLAEAVDYLRAVAPARAFPIHEAVAAVPGMFYGRFSELAPEKTQVQVIDDSEPVTI